MKVTLVLLGVFIASAFSTYIPLKYASFLGAKEPRIVNGDFAKAGQFPWQVALTVSDADGNEFRCAGCLVHNLFVVTAAHCLVGATKITLRYGSLYYDQGEEREATSWMSHEKYDDFWKYSDVALIYTKDPIYETDTIKTIPMGAEPLTGGEKVTVSGWGLTEDQSYPNELRFIEIETITNEECNKNHRTDETQLCCVGINGKSACFGDSGGPLVQYDAEGKASLAGVVSFGHPDGCYVNMPFGFARVEYFYGWIVEAMYKLTTPSAQN